MNTSADAADQVVKITLEGAEWAVRLAGTGAKHIGVMLYAMSKEQNKTRGAERLNNMLRSGKPLKVYTFSAKDMDKFKEVAKQYGILYTILKEKDRTGDVFDVLVRADDESKIQRICDRFNLTKVDTATLKAEILKEKAEREKNGESKKESNKDREKDGKGQTDTEGQEPPVPEQTEEEYEEGVTEKLLSEKPIQKEEHSYANPGQARTDMQSRRPALSGSEKKTGAEMENESLSEPTSNGSNEENKSVFPVEHGERESIRNKIARIKKEKQAASKNDLAPEPVKAPAPKRKER